MNNDYGLEELQRTMLGMLKDLHSFCTANGIEYCLAYGSVLGAIRHHGFIPWDDDVDVYMTRENFIRFCEVFDSFAGDKYYLQRLYSVKGKCTIPKIRMNHTFYEDPMLDGWDIHKGIYIDIFVLYDAPDSLVGRSLQYVSNMYILLKNLSNNPNYRKSALVNTLLKLLRCFPKDFLLETAYKRLDAYAGSSGCDYFDTDQRQYKKAFVKRDLFFSAKEAPFEDTWLYVPSDAKGYLKISYGDYMRIPNNEQITRKRHVLRWDIQKEIDYSSENNGRFCDEAIK